MWRAGLWRGLNTAVGVVAAAALTGCGVQTSGTVDQTQSGVNGRVHGGQQPVSGATIQLYTVGMTGDGSAATPLLTQTVTTGADGSFTITGLYNCTSATQVYILATGGNPGAGGVNPNLAMMTALGPCTSLSSSTFIFINELTTVAAVFALQPYMTSPTAVGSSSTDAGSLTQAMTLAAEFVDPSSGSAPGSTLPAGVTDPVNELDTLGDILAACVNSTGGTTNDGSQCGTLFHLSPTLNGTMPTDTLTAVLNIAKNPTANTNALVALASATAPFQPVVASAPQDLTPQLSAAGSLTVSPGVLHFPDTGVNLSSSVQTATVTNNTASPAYFYGTAQGTGFSLVPSQTSCASGRMDPGASCVLAYVLYPSTTGVQQEVVNISPPTLTTAPTLTLIGTGLAGSGGNVSLSQTTLSFGANQAPQSTVLHNYTQSSVAVRSISFNQSPGFTETDDCPTTLPSLGYCTITVTPGLTGSRSSTLSVITSAAVAPVTASVSSNLVQAFSGPVSFGAVPVGQSSTVLVTVFDTLGVGDGYSRQAGVSGANASDFTATLSGCSGNSNYAGCSIGVTFSPSATGLRQATVSFGGASASLSGLGGSSSTLFTVTDTTTTPQPPTYLITTTSTAQTNLNMTWVISGPGAGQFTVSSNQCTTPTLTPGQSCSFQVTGDGKSNSTALLTVTDTISGQQQGITLANASMTYPSPTYVFSPTSFPATHLNQSSTATLTVTSPFGDPILFFFSQGINSEFAITGPTYCARNASPCQIQVTFTPTVAGSASVNVGVIDTISGQFGYASTTGTGGIAAYSAPASYDFGTVTIGTPAMTTLTVTNTGDGSGKCPAFALSGAASADYTVTQSQAGNSLAAGAFCSVGVKVVPNGTGARAATLTATTTVGTTLTIQLTANGTF